MRVTTLLLALAVSLPLSAQVDTSILTAVGYHPSDVTYYNTPYLANSLAMGSEWLEFSGFDFGTSVPYSAETSQFVNGYPQFLGTGGSANNRGPFLRAILFGLNINNTSVRPTGWPARDALAKGRYVLTWQGNADIRLKSGTFVAAASTVPETGSASNGRRVYDCATIPESLEIRQIVTPITDLDVWLPDPDNPTGSLENQTFHPLFLERLADADWSFIRFMDWGKTNASPQQDWADRRLPSHVFQGGILNSRQPSAASDGNRETGVAWEHMVALCNATGRNLWINVPHLATTDSITKLARLIRFGSDGVNPYTTTNASPVFPPLNGGLKVYVEFSNEIWSSGFAFPQGDWAQEQGNLLFPGDPNAKPKFTARKFCDTWKIFQTVFAGETSRLVRVAAIFTAGVDSYSRPFLTEMGTYGQTLSPAVRPDVLALTTYFGNDIQGFVDDSGYTSGKLFSDSYWQSALFATHMHLAFDEWKRRILSGDSASGSGPDATGTSGGFASSLRTLAKETLPYCPQDANALPCLPLVAYEGGPSIFTDSIDSGNTTTDDNVTIFMEAMNRDPRIADVYRMHLELAKSKGLWTHDPYTDTSAWSRFGQWGHLEVLAQDPASSPKYALMLEHFSLYSTLRHIDNALDLIPSFVTSATLPTGIAGQSYSTNITTTGGNGARSIVVVGSLLDAGLAITSPSADTLQISGTPMTSRKNYILARVEDGDGDPAWRTFTLQTFGGPGTLVQSNFSGTSPALNRPFTQTFVLSNKVTWGGWDIGAGVTPASTNDVFAFSVDGPSDSDSTLAEAISDNEFLTATVTPATPPLDLRGAEVRFSTKRIDFHSPTAYALHSSVDGFANPLYTSTAVDKGDDGETEHVVTLPETAAFQSIASTVTFRIVAFGARFSGHRTSLTGFKLTEKQPLTISAISPALGSTAGGQSVIIDGTGLSGATSVTFGGAAGTITDTTATAITVTTPAAAAGAVTVVVTTPSGNLALTGAYRYVSAPSSIAINPSSGSVRGGTTVTITGTNLGNATSVTFGGLPAPFIANTATAIVVTTPAHAAGAVSVGVTTPGGSVTATNGYTYVAAPSAPSGLAAAAVSSSQVSLTWNAVGGATSYRVERRAAGEISFTQIGTPATNAFSDTGRPSDSAFLYRVRTVSGADVSAGSAGDLATTTIFTDPTLTTSTTVKSAHITQLRTAVNAVRALAGQSAFSFTGTAAAGTTISATHLTELRSALDAAREALGLTTGGYTDNSLAAVAIKKQHVEELRTRVQ